MKKNYVGRIIAVSLALSMIMTGTMTAFAGVKTSGVKAEYDEAYYVTTDYYGNITDGSIVKSYTLNGQRKITDYGKYNQVNNLSDEREAEQKGDRIEFSFTEDEVPKHFYYECKTEEPYAELPWDISVKYKLNGKQARAEELAGEKGIIEIDMDLIPNKAASKYSRNNYSIETTALFNDDDITSFEADGAQVQLVGNIRMALFVGLPGEEQHLNIKVGSDDFEFGGVTFLMVPVTLGQLSEVSKLAEDKEKIEDHYRKLSRHLDNTLDSFDHMEDNLSKTASDLKKVADDASRIANTTSPVASELTDAKQMLNDSLDVVDPMLKNLVSLKFNLSELWDVVDCIQGDLDDADDKIVYLTEIRNDLEDTADTLEEMKNLEVGIDDIDGTAQKACQLHALYIAQTGGAIPFEDFLYGVLFQQIYPQCLEGVREAAIQKLIEQGYSREQATYFIDNDPETRSEIENTANTLAAQKTKDSSQKLIRLYKLYMASTSNGSYDSLAIINDTVGDLHNNLQESLDAPEDLLRDTNSLIGDVRDYRRLIRDMNKLGDITKETVVIKGQEILDEIDALNQIINDYRPSADTLAQNLIDTSAILNETTVDTGVMLDDIGDALQDAANDIDPDGDLRETKDEIFDKIEDIWHEYTGDKNNLLLMDANAEPVSLSGEKNDNPKSIQVVIRTQEIKKDEIEADAVAELNKNAGNTNKKMTLGERISKMFNDLFGGIKKLFVREAE